MSKIFFNISNHPQSGWSQRQLEAALVLADDVTGINFPNIDPRATTEEVVALAGTIAGRIPDGSVCMIMGESSMVYALTNLLRDNCVLVVATTERKVVEVTNSEGTVVKTATFEFVQFRRLN